VKKVQFNLSSLKETTPHEYALRFLFGGLCTVAAGLIAKHYGPVVGGLFLAFPAIFPASATLIEDHEKKRKRQIGSDGRYRGRIAASLDSIGAALGCIGLVGFAFINWKWLPYHNAYGVIFSGVLVWSIVSFSLWVVYSKKPFR
jgi:hypothetical protein